jgi:AP-1 complex subunit beta-1
MLELNNIFTVAKRNANGADLCYVSCRFVNNIVVLAELTIRPDMPTVQLALKTLTGEIVPGVQRVFEGILQACSGSDC